MLSGPLIWGEEQQLGAASLSRQQAQAPQSLLYWASNGAGVSSLGIDAPCMAQPLQLSEHQRQKLGNRVRTLPCPHFFPYSLPACPFFTPALLCLPGDFCTHSASGILLP